MGEVAEQVGRFVNAYSGDLRDESLDGQRVVVGGIVTGMRTVITKRQETMAIATIEDLQGSIEVVVFPRLFETTRADLARRRRSCSSPAGSTTRARRSRSWPTSWPTGTTPWPAARRPSPARSRPAIAAAAAVARVGSRSRSGRVRAARGAVPCAVPVRRRRARLGAGASMPTGHRRTAHAPHHPGRARSRRTSRPAGAMAGDR